MPGGITIDPAVRATLGARLAALGGAPITLALLVSLRPPDEQGLYFILVNAFAIASLFEIGLGTVVVQFSSHASVGVDRIAVYTFPTARASTEELDSVISASMRWYSRAAIAVLGILLALGVIVIGRDPAAAGTSFRVAGLLVAVTTAVYIVLIPVITILEGAGDIVSVQNVRFVQAAAGLLVAWILLYAANAFTAVAGLALTQLIVVVGWLLRARMLLTKRAFAALTRGKRVNADAPAFAITQSKALLTWLPPVIATQSATVIALWYFGAADAGRVGMGLTLAIAPLTLGNAWLYARFPVMGKLAAVRSTQELRALGFAAMRQAVLVCVVGATAVTAAVGFATSMWPATAERVVTWPAVAALGAYAAGNVFHLGLASMLRAHRRESLALASALASLTAVVAATAGGWSSTADALCIGFGLAGLFATVLLSVTMFQRAWQTIA